MLLATGLKASAFDAGIDVALFDLLPGWIGPLLVVGVIVNTIALNAMTTYTSSMALQAIGFRLRRIPAAIIVGLVGTALTIYLVLSSSLLEAANLLLQFLVIVSGPAMAIYVVDVLRRHYVYDGADLFDDRRGGRYWYTGGWSIPGMGALLLGGLRRRCAWRRTSGPARSRRRSAAWISRCRSGWRSPRSRTQC